jgi:hypothetical protein
LLFSRWVGSYTTNYKDAPGKSIDGKFPIYWNIGREVRVDSLTVTSRTSKLVTAASEGVCHGLSGTWLRRVFSCESEQARTSIGEVGFAINMLIVDASGKANIHKRKM